MWFCALLFAVLGSTAPVWSVCEGSTASVGLAGRELSVPVGLAGEMPTAPGWAVPKKHGQPKDCGLAPKVQTDPESAGRLKKCRPAQRVQPKSADWSK